MSELLYVTVMTWKTFDVNVWIFIEKFKSELPWAGYREIFFLWFVKTKPFGTQGTSELANIQNCYRMT